MQKIKTTEVVQHMKISDILQSQNFIKMEQF